MAERDLGTQLAELAEPLYAGLPADFTPSRDAAAKQVGDKELAAAVKKLKKPAVAAWALNNLVRREADQIAQVLALAESLRSAAEALDGEELRALNRQRRQLTHALATTARRLAAEDGVRLTDPVVDQVEGMLTAAMLDRVAAQAVRTGRVHTPFTSTGVTELDATTVVAVPEALDVTARPVEAPAPEAPQASLRVVPDDAARLARARDAVAEAEGTVRKVEEEVGEHDEAVERLRARRLQLQGEADELRRRLAQIEDDVEAVDDELEDAEQSRAEARASLEEARAAQAEAVEALDRLEG